jgi:SAM-dependent methyltransferase
MEKSPGLSPQSDSYDARYFEPLFAIEDKHFWFRSRNLIISGLVQRMVQRFQPGYRVLEVGCGTGNTLRALEETCTEGTVIGMDLFGEGLHYARRRVSCDLVLGDLHVPPFSTQFDVIGLFDVLEHISDDVSVLSDLHAMLKPGGFLILTVPAHMSLWSYFDEASHHRRRYEYAELKEKLEQTGYYIEFLTSYMTSIFPLVWLGRRLAACISNPHKTQDEDAMYELAKQELKITPGVNRVLLFILSLEAHYLMRHLRLPFGTSLLAIAQPCMSSTSNEC